MRTNPDLLLRNICGKHILVPIRRNTAGNEPILLNSVAADIWNFADNCTSEKEIIAAISKKYDIEYNSAEIMSVIDFISVLKKSNLLID